MKKILAILAIIFLMSVPVLAQAIDYCEGDFDNDGDQDGSDTSVVKTDFGRSLLVLGTLGLNSIAFRELPALLVPLDELTLTVSDNLLG